MKEIHVIATLNSMYLNTSKSNEIHVFYLNTQKRILVFTVLNGLYFVSTRAIQTFHTEIVL